MKNIRRLAIAVFSGLLLAGSLWADQVKLNNGDILSGTVVKSDGKKLVLKTDYAGEISIDWAMVKGVVTSEVVHLLLKDGQTVVGKVEMKDDAVQVSTKDAGTVSTSIAAITDIRSGKEQAAYEASLGRLRNPMLRDLWKGFFDAGIATTRGNAETSTVNFGMNAARITTRDKIATYFTAINTKATTSGKSFSAANAVRGGIRYDANISSKSFVFGFTDLEFDEFQKLDLRFVGGGGVGYSVYKKDANFFNVFGGGAMNKEFFSTGLERTSGELLMGEELSKKLNGRMLVTEKMVYYPNISESGQYRLNFDTSVVTKINKWFNWQVTLSDRYLSNPVRGNKNNDTLFTTGVRLTFGE